MNNSMPHHVVEVHDMVICEHFHHLGKIVEGMVP